MGGPTEDSRFVPLVEFYSAWGAVHNWERETGGIASGPSAPRPRGFRGRVLRRDKNTCQTCGANEKLEVNHIIPARKGRINQDWNGITLCHKCHLLLNHNELPRAWRRRYIACVRRLGFDIKYVRCPCCFSLHLQVSHLGEPRGQESAHG